jgi:hypothetical protein
MEQLYAVLLSFSLISCIQKSNNPPAVVDPKNRVAINRYAQIISIPLPSGFERPKVDSNSFCAYLRNIYLKKQTNVFLYNGLPKRNQTAQYAVLDISVGNSDLQQCADAAMRLRAEYLFNQKNFEQIKFYDNDHTVYTFSPPFTREHFDKYLNRVFGMCGSSSLSKQLNRVKTFSEIQPGDVIIRGGFPGHAVIVMDVAVNDSGKKIFLLAQSYMPAQDIHVLKNPTNENLSPWYEVNGDHFILTPEYTFTKKELMRW